METQKKFAIIKFDGHRKKLTYLSQKGKSDLQAVREAILSSKDDTISQCVKYCSDMIVEILDTDVDAKVELSSDEVLNTVSELDISFIYNVSHALEQDVRQQIEDLSEILPGTSNSECTPNVIISPSRNNTPYSSENESAIMDTIPVSFVLILYLTVRIC